jgi:hypothetical protein
VKAARAAISAAPGAEEVLRQDWIKAAHFYAKFGITETLFRYGAPANVGESSKDFLDPTRTPFEWQEEVHGRAGQDSLNDTMICATEPIQRPSGAWTIRACLLK